VPKLRSSQIDFDELFSDAAPSEQPNSAADSVDQWVGTGRQRRKPVSGPPRQSARVINEFYEEARTRAMSGDWDGAKPQHLVGLYMFCHERVYGIRPLELNEHNFVTAVQHATKQLRVNFGNDIPKVAEFMRWVWDRERNKREYLLRRAQERQVPKPDLRRIGWQLQFMANSPLITDYYAG
jgi:hypothetical protein